jgi:DNA-binding GntR family transcriptional regulator
VKARDELPISMNSLKDEVKLRLRKWIVNGRLKPGQRIIETEIAKQFGTSQVPVREALRGLEEEGLVRTVQYKGAYVTDLILDEIYHAFLLRAQIEGNVLKLIIPTMTEKHYIQLEKIVEQMRRVEGDTAYVLQSQLDVQFHRQLIQWAEIDIYLRIWGALDGHVQRFITLTHPSYFSDNRQGVLKQHEDLITVFKQRDVKMAQAAMTKHIMLIWNHDGLELLKKLELNSTDESDLSGGLQRNRREGNVGAQQ